MGEKSMSKDTRKNVILLHIAVMCFSCSGVIGQYVQIPAVQVAMGRVICSSLLLLAISLVCKDKLTLDSKKDYGLMILTGVVMAIHWSSFFQSIQTSSVAIGTITFSTFPLFLTFLEPLLFHEKIRGKNILNALILLMGVLITIPEFSVENKVTSGILWGMLASFTYAVMTLSNRYFSSRYKGRTICLYEQGTAAIALLPALVLVKAEWRPVDFAGVATIGFLCTAIAYSPISSLIFSGSGIERIAPFFIVISAAPAFAYVRISFNFASSRLSRPYFNTPLIEHPQNVSPAPVVSIAFTVNPGCSTRKFL